MSKPRLLDLFCGAGGCAAGYVRAGLEVHGVDHLPQKRYLLSGASSFVQADALEYLARHGREYDVIHASPPCKRFSAASRRNRHGPRHPDLLTPTRQALQDGRILWVIENVPGAPIRPPAVCLCGLMFGLEVFRHRLFESPLLLFAPPHLPHGDRRIGADGMCSVHGHGDYSPSNWRREERKYQHVAAWREAMGIGWMSRDELSQAIPPPHTELVGRQLYRAIGG